MGRAEDYNQKRRYQDIADKGQSGYCFISEIADSKLDDLMFHLALDMFPIKATGSLLWGAGLVLRVDPRSTQSVFGALAGWRAYPLVNSTTSSITSSTTGSIFFAAAPLPSACRRGFGVLRTPSLISRDDVMARPVLTAACSWVA